MKAIRESEAFRVSAKLLSMSTSSPLTLGRHQPPIDSRIERPLAVVGRFLCHGVRARCRDGQHAPDDAAAQRPVRNLIQALPHVETYSAVWISGLPASRRLFIS